MTTFLQLDDAQLEYVWHGPPPDVAPTIVFAHEGLGSVSLWRDVPQQLAALTGCGALVYSRAGYGRSSAVDLPRPITFMHHEADVLAQILVHTSIQQAVLFGHSDGASIALIHAGRYPDGPVRGLVLEAPHVFTEPEGLASITNIAEVYRTTNLREKLARHHRTDVDGAFWGWNDVWLNSDFKRWNIEAYLPAITVPTLLIQGEQDEYGTWAQIEAIERQIGGTVQTLKLADCGHAPHRDQPTAVLTAAATFIAEVMRAAR